MIPAWTLALLACAPPAPLAPRRGPASGPRRRGGPGSAPPGRVPGGHLPDLRLRRRERRRLLGARRPRDDRRRALSRRERHQDLRLRRPAAPGGAGRPLPRRSAPRPPLSGEPLFAPGEGYAYGDTHYILAGEALERATGLGLGPALRDTLDYAALGLGDTWLESLEDPPTSDALDRLTHPYDGGIDTRDWDPSWDLYGGGGLVSTAPDLATFIEALVGGDLLGPAALSAMMEVDPVAEGAFFGIDGAPGINGFCLQDGGRCWAGYGYFGTAAVHCPEADLTWAYTQNQANPRRPDAIDEAVLAAWESTI